MATAKEYGLLKQSTRRINIKIDLLNKDGVIVSSFEGIAIDGRISTDSNSVYRRSGELKMVFDKKYNLYPRPDSKIWFGKKCAISIGLKDYRDEITWFKIGVFVMDEVSIAITASERTLSCRLKDYMAMFDGSLGGTLSHQVLIEANSATINEAIATTISSLSKYSMENIGIDGSTALVPYTIEKQSGSTIYELINELIQLYKGFDFYFNIDGYFLVEKIKDRTADPIIEEFDSSDKDFTINATTKIDFTNVKNTIQVWGRQLDNGVKIQWVYRNRYSRKTLLEMQSILDMNLGDICHLDSDNTSYYWNENWIALDFKVIPRFNIENIGEKIKTISNDKIFTEAQARLQCEYELSNHSNFAETISFDCVPLYHLQPQNKIGIYIDDDINGEYLINTISTPLDINSSMSVTCHKLYY